MLLPLKFNEGFSVEWLHEGQEMKSFDEAELKSILLFDQYYKQRELLGNELIEKIINPLIMLINKHYTLKGILVCSDEPVNRLLYSLIGDAGRQNITDFYDLMEKFIKIIEQYKSNYSRLFDKNSQKNLFAALIQGKNLNQIYKYNELGNLIDQQRDYLFSDFDQNGKVQKNSWDQLTQKVRQNRNIIKAYRDKVASHADEERIILDWKEATRSIESFFDHVVAINTVIAFKNRFEKQSDEMRKETTQTMDLLRNVLFVKAKHVEQPFNR